MYTGLQLADVNKGRLSFW